MRILHSATRADGADASKPTGSEPTRAVIAARLAELFGAPAPAAAAGPELRAAAVALVLCRHADELGVLLTLRAERMTRHASQFALPGGRLDPGETHEVAVLRELAEELGVALGAEAIVGRLPDYDTRSGFRLRPLVLWAERLGALRPAPDEVAEVFHVPLAALVDPAVPRLLEVDGLEKPVIQLPLGDQLIHAPTGAILHQFGRAAVAGEYVDASQFEEPHFAWS